MKIQPNNKDSYPLSPGIYRMTNKDGDIIYIGKAKNLKNRLTSYFDSSSKSPRIKLMIQEIDHIEITTTASENDALVLEQRLINKIKPKYNIIFRDDKSYPFISLSKHEFPKIYITREKSTNIKKENLFGPYPRKEDAYKNVEYIQKLFKLRTCTDNEFSHRSRPCILHSIEKCNAPCVNKKDPTFVHMYSENVNKAKRILKGDISSTISDLEKEMISYSANFEYEKAAQLRDIIQSIQDLSSNQTIYSVKSENLIIFNYIKDKNTFIGYTKIIDGTPQQVFDVEIKDEVKEYSIEEILTRYIETEMSKKENENLHIVTPIELNNLFYSYQYKNLKKQYKDWLLLVKNNLIAISNEQDRLDKKNSSLSESLKDIFIMPIRNIDCIDISHYNGEATYGGQIRWKIESNNNNFLDKNGYRLSKFPGNIIDDVKHINQTVARIYNNYDHRLPSILIIDGDKPQMDAAFRGLEEIEKETNFILLCSAKGVSRKKGEETFYVHPNSLHLINPVYLKQDILLLSANSPTRLLIQYLQDTAHNFSNSARKKKMSKDRFSS